jgi:hypothetical protein
MPSGTDRLAPTRSRSEDMRRRVAFASELGPVRDLEGSTNGDVRVSFEAVSGLDGWYVIGMF